MIMNKKAIIALSGGLDSTTLTYWAVNQGYELEAVGFFYKQKHSKELDCARWHCERLGIPFACIDISFLGEITNSSLVSGEEDVPEGYYSDPAMRSTVVPFRNGIFLSILASKAESSGARYILYAAHSGDHAIYPDCRPSFEEPMKAAIKNGTYNGIELASPFIGYSKAEILKVGLALDVPYEKTWSCYRGGEAPCGRCGTCVERTEAFLKNSVKDPLLAGEQWDEAVGFYKMKK